MIDQIVMGVVFGVIVTVAAMGVLNIISEYFKDKEENRKREINSIIRSVDRLDIEIIRLRADVERLKHGEGGDKG